MRISGRISFSLSAYDIVTLVCSTLILNLSLTVWTVKLQHSPLIPVNALNCAICEVYPVRKQQQHISVLVFCTFNMFHFHGKVYSVCTFKLLSHVHIKMGMWISSQWQGNVQLRCWQIYAADFCSDGFSSYYLLLNHSSYCWRGSSRWLWSAVAAGHDIRWTDEKSNISNNEIEQHITSCSLIDDDKNDT